MVIVTTYYPLKKCKYPSSEYDKWIRNFFKYITTDIVFICSNETKELYQEITGKNVMFIVRDITSLDSFNEQELKLWTEFNNTDSESVYHSPELLAIWSAKQEFVRIAMEHYDDNIYIWCDIGVIRTQPTQVFNFSKTHKFIEPNKITCLDVGRLCGKPTTYIGGGILAGDKSAWLAFSKEYCIQLHIQRQKDQCMFTRMLNKSNSVIIPATYEFGNPWFCLLYVFSD
jgi:hypothetical protein